MAKEYNAIVMVGDTSLGKNGFIKYRKISFLTKFKVFIDDKYPKWRFATIYDNETKQKIELWKR